MNKIFMSRARRTAFAPCCIESMTTHIRNFLLLFLCISECYTVCGQQVLWLYVPQQQPANFFHDQKSDLAINEITPYNGFNSDSRLVAAKNLMTIVPLTSQAIEPNRFHRSRYVALNTPYMARKYGYEDAMKIGHEWYEPFYRSKIYEDSSTETVFMNHGLIPLPKSTIMRKGSNGVDEDLDSGSNGSGSTEITATSEEGMRSIAPRQSCTLEGSQGRYHPETDSCYTIGTKGPCGKYMIFVASDDFNGYCECDQGSNDRPLVQIGKQCHLLYTQAICPPGYWLTLLTSSTGPECQPNPCYQPPIAEKYLHNRHTKKSKSFTKLVTSIKTDLVPFKGECIRLNNPSRHCGREGEVVLFPEGRTEPACGFPKSTRRIYRRQISSVPRFRCNPGKVLHQPTKRCISRSSRRILRFMGVESTVRRRSVR